jgi:hypothetical protein
MRLVLEGSVKDESINWSRGADGQLAARLGTSEREERDISLGPGSLMAKENMAGKVMDFGIGLREPA